MRKELTDEDLEVLGRLFAQMFEEARSAWELAMRTLRVDSRAYQLICQSGKRVQFTLAELREEAAKRRWSDERKDQVFGSYTYVLFD